MSQVTAEAGIPLHEEQGVIDRLKGGDREALSQLYSWYGDRLYRSVILRHLPSPERAEDVLAITFARAMERIHQFQPQGKSIFFWLRRIAINLAMDEHRRRKRDRLLKAAAAQRAEVADPYSLSHLPSPDRSVVVDETRALVEETLDLLHPRYATALRLRLLEDRDRTECAELMEVTLGNFDVILHRASKAFRNKYPPR